jgi:hypothetical protein
MVSSFIQVLLPKKAVIKNSHTNSYKSHRNGAWARSLCVHWVRLDKYFKNVLKYRTLSGHKSYVEACNIGREVEIKQYERTIMGLLTFKCLNLSLDTTHATSLGRSLQIVQMFALSCGSKQLNRKLGNRDKALNAACKITYDWVLFRLPKQPSIRVWSGPPHSRSFAGPAWLERLPCATKAGRNTTQCAMEVIQASINKIDSFLRVRWLHKVQLVQRQWGRGRMQMAPRFIYWMAYVIDQS